MNWKGYRSIAGEEILDAAAGLFEAAAGGLAAFFDAMAGRFKSLFHAVTRGDETAFHGFTGGFEGAADDVDAAFFSGLAADAGAPDPDALAHKWHILMKGSIVAAGEGDQLAATRAQEMGRLLLASEGLAA